MQNFPSSLFGLRDATINARYRNNDASIGTEARNGFVRIVSVTYAADGTSIVTPLSGWMSPTEAVDYLGTL